MTLLFSKKNNEPEVKLEIGGKKRKFDYLLMIKTLHEKKKIGQVKYSAEYTDVEKEKLGEMIDSICQVVLK